jgi:hypothetical protein
MLCRISLLLGRPPSEVRALPLSDLQMLGAYWEAEPWGPWRDNLHAGLIAATVANSGPRKLKKTVRASDFMLVPARERRAKGGKALLSALRAMASKPGEAKAAPGSRPTTRSKRR